MKLLATFVLGASVMGASSPVRAATLFTAPLPAAAPGSTVRR
jgi:hypothetical protein